MLVQLANLGRPFALRYEPQHGLWNLQIVLEPTRSGVFTGSVLKEVVREAHKAFHAA